MGAAIDSTPPSKKRTRKAPVKSAAARKPRANSTRPKTAPPAQETRWLWIIPLLAFGLITALAVVSYAAGDGTRWALGEPTHNWVGPAGHYIGKFLFHAVGISAYGVTLALLTAGVLACTKNGLRFAFLATFGWVLVGTAASSLAHILADGASWPDGSSWAWPPGGALGRSVGDAARGAFSVTGSLVLLGALLLMAVLIATHFAAARAFEAAARGVGSLSVSAAKGVYGAWDRSRRARAMRAELSYEEEQEWLEANEDGRLPVFGNDDEEYEDEEEDEEPAPPPRRAARLKAPEPVIRTPPAPLPPRLVLPDIPPDTLGDEEPEEVEEKPKPRAKKAAPKVVEVAPEELTLVAEPEDEESTKGAPVSVTSKPGAKAPAIIEPKAPPKALPTNRPVGGFAMAEGKSGFHLPTIDELLDMEVETTVPIDRAMLTATATKLVQKLLDLGVDGEVTEIRPGPVVTMYEFKPGSTIKLARIASLGDDLKMAMEAMSVRIVAPIPGKGVVGFEVPNKTRQTVFLKSVVEQEAFQKGASKLTMAIGKDIEGMPYVSDLAKMPHLLIAGTTGSGKSVAVNAMLVSMLMRATPEELRLIMVDPKMLELSIYDGIPHLLLPVVTDPRKAALALRWGVEEMERRYEMMAKAGVRNLAQFNKYVEKELARRAEEPVDVAVDGGDDEDFEPAPELPKLEKLPLIVIVIDELADLMMVAAKEVEVFIARLAQMARASGIHLMVATQRPSTDVLTGVIKANFPSRISFKVASRHDSGTIINATGAENLLGMGDMLIMPPGTSSVTRVHGAYVTETEINRLTAFWKKQGTPVYDPEILKPRDEGGGGDDADDELADELYDQALHAVSEMKGVSISLLQRKMRIGYNRAARMIERMERDGVVGPADGSKPREVLIRPVGEM